MTSFSEFPSVGLAMVTVSERSQPLASLIVAEGLATATDAAADPPGVYEAA